MFKFLRRKQARTVRQEVERIFAEALDQNTIDPDGNFFELGGDSILATIVVTSLEEAGHVVPSTAVFDHPTINSLVKYIESGDAPASAGAARKIQPLARDSAGVSRLRASLLQERLWPYERNPDPERFQLRGEGAVLLTGALDISALKQSLTLIVQRHEVLRSSFAEEGGLLFSDVHPATAVSLALMDAIGDTADARREDAARKVAKVTSKVFDLGQPPPFRCALVRIGDTEHVLAVSMHHIVSDGWSMGLLVNEIAKAYDSFAKDKTPHLPDLPFQFADYAAWHWDWLESEAGQASIDFWRTYLSGLAPALEIQLPADKPRQNVFNFPVRRTPIQLGPQAQDAMRMKAKSTQTSVHTVFLAGVLRALSTLSDTTDLPVGIMHANRNTPGTQNLIGFFSTLVMLRFRFDTQDGGISGMIEKVRAATREVEPHSGVPIGVLMDEGIADTLPRIFVDSVPRPEMPSIEGLTLQDFPFEHPPLFAVADIALFLFDNGTELSCLLGTNEDMFSDSATEQLANAITEALTQM